MGCSTRRGRKGAFASTRPMTWSACGPCSGYLDEGMAAAEAATLVRREEPRRPEAPGIDARTARLELAAALDAFDESRAQAILDELLAAATVDTMLSDVVLPFLDELGRPLGAR